MLSLSFLDYFPRPHPTHPTQERVGASGKRDFAIFELRF